MATKTCSPLTCVDLPFGIDLVEVVLVRTRHRACRGHAVGWDELSASDGNPYFNAQRSLHAACGGLAPDASLVLPVATCFAVLSSDIQTPWVESVLTAGATIEVLEAAQHGQITIPDCG